MADDLNVSQGAGKTIRSRDPGDGKLRQVVALGAIDTDGATGANYVNSASANQDSTVVKASAGTLYSVTVDNNNAAVRWVKVYDKATGPTSADTPVLRLRLRASSGPQHFPFPAGRKFQNGIGFRITTGSTDGDTGAATSGDHVLDFTYG